MKKSRFTEEQMVTILREADKAPVAEVSKKHGISEQTIYNWRQHFGGMDAADVKRLKQLEQENVRLKKMLAERDLELDVMKEINAKKLVSAPARRQQVAYAKARGLSERRACAPMSVARSALNYESRLAGRDAPVLAAMCVLSTQYPRYGYRRIQIFLDRQGHPMSADRAWRLWRLAGLQVPRKRPRRRVSVHRPRPQPATTARHVWAYDFVFDACANVQQLKCLTVIDEYTRECLALDVAGSIRSSRVIEVLSRLISEHGAPRYLRSDNGPEFVSNALLKWATQNGMDMALSDPGKPWQNGADESFNGKFRDECLSLEWFRTRTEAKVVIEQWRCHYNAVRSHSSLAYLTPNEFKQRYCSTGATEAVFQD
ncbi:IS3 family transposase [Burkholderia plantarii]|uniref:IS3 family transposase n=1 Tax=Burkholderia plantarii TaxID=41899 RepID=UPI00114CF748|nr:IS3 family transposase [Burkholderia plantarii]